MKLWSLKGVFKETQQQTGIVRLKVKYTHVAHNKVGRYQCFPIVF